MRTGKVQSDATFGRQETRLVTVMLMVLVSVIAIGDWWLAMELE